MANGDIDKTPALPGLGEFTKYGLLGCCVGAIVLFQWYSQHEAAKTAAWAFENIKATAAENNDRAREDRETLKESMRQQWQATQRMGDSLHEMALNNQRVLDEVRGARVEIKGARVEVGSVQKQVAEVKKTVEGKEP